MSSRRTPLGEKLRTLMAGRRDEDGRAHTSRSLSASVEALAGEHASVSHAAIAKLANGSQDNPTVGTVLALCEALGGVPPAYLLPHESYEDLAALEAFEDPLARRVLVLLAGLPRSEVDEVVAGLEGRRAALGLPATPDGETAAAPARRRRRRSRDETAEYAADSLEGL